MKKRILPLLVLSLLAAQLTAQPVITSQPVDQPVVWGGTATFSVMVTGIGPLTYQWQLNGTNLPNNIITTVAGNGNFNGNLGDGGSAIIASLNAPQCLAVDAIGNVFISDKGNNCIRKLGTNGVITRIAGNGTAGFGGDGGPAISAILNFPVGIALGAGGNLYIADLSNGRIREVNTNGIISTLASGLANPTGVACDALGNIFIAEQSRHCILKIDTNGVTSTVAGIRGNFASGYSGDGGPATNAYLNFPTGVAVDTAGNLFIADYGNNVIRKVDTNGIITTFAGNGAVGYSGDGGAATNATFNSPLTAWADINGNVLIPDQYNCCIRKVDTNGVISTVAGVGYTSSNIGDGGPAVVATLNSPTGVTSDMSRNMFIADTANNCIRKVDTNGIISSIAGNGTTTYTGDSGSANSARLGSPTGVAADTFGNFFIADRSFQRIRKVDANGVITTIAGNGVAGYNGNGPALLSKLNNPNNVVIDNLGSPIIADQSNNRIRKVRANGLFSTIAGTGTASFSGDGSAATLAAVNSPAGVALDAAGNLFIVDQSNQRIRKVDTNGIITTVAGNGTAAYSGDGGAATNASLNNPAGIAVDAGGNLLIADKSNNRVRKVNTNGVISTVAGTNTSGFSGDGGLAMTNRLNGPTSVAVDSDGNLFISDQNNNRIRQVGTNGTITTIAGTGIGSFSGDGGLATNAAICLPAAVAVDIAGNLFIADQNNYRVRKVTFSNKPYLTLINVNFNNASNYSVVVTSASGSVTSSVATVNLQLPPITPVFTASNSICTLTWNTISNQTYQLQSATNLVAPNWIDLGSPITATNNSVSVTDNGGSDGQRFYRVRLWP